MSIMMKISMGDNEKFVFKKATIDPSDRFMYL